MDELKDLCESAIRANRRFVSLSFREASGGLLDVTAGRGLGYKGSGKNKSSQTTCLNTRLRCWFRLMSLLFIRTLSVAFCAEARRDKCGSHHRSRQLRKQRIGLARQQISYLGHHVASDAKPRIELYGCLGRSVYGIALIGLLVASMAAQARGLTCWDMASLRYGVPVEILVAIAKQESNFNAKAISPPNANGSRDIGMMQINEWWLPKLEAYGITRKKLIDPCINLNVGAWILSQEFERHGYTWEAIGAYNAKSPDKRMAYAKNILKHLQTIEQNKRRLR